MKPSVSLPKTVQNEYRHFLLGRSLGSAGLVGMGIGACFLLDFSGLRYPAGAVLLVLTASFLLACLLFGLHRIVFHRSWTGTIQKIDVKKEKRVKLHASTILRDRLFVCLTIDRGTGKPYILELWDEGMEHAGERTEMGTARAIPKNKFYEEAPYKEGDTVVYLRGLRYPFRYGVKTEGIFDPRYVCPYCGEINREERNRCFRCGRTLPK